MFTKKGIFSSSSGKNDQTFQFPSSFYSWVASLLILIVSTSTAWADYALRGWLMDGWDIDFCFLGASLTLPFIRGDSKFEMGDRRCPVNVRGRGSKGLHIKIIVQNAIFLFPICCHIQTLNSTQTWHLWETFTKLFHVTPVILSFETIFHFAYFLAWSKEKTFIKRLHVGV